MQTSAHRLFFFETILLEVASRKCTTCLPDAHLGSLVPLFCLDVAVYVRVPQDERTQLYTIHQKMLWQMVPVDTLWAKPGWGCSDPLAPLLSFSSKYFSILVLKPLLELFAPECEWNSLWFGLWFSIRVYPQDFLWITYRKSRRGGVQAAGKFFHYPQKHLKQMIRLWMAAMRGICEQALPLILNLSLFEEGNLSKRHALRTWKGE